MTTAGGEGQVGVWIHQISRRHSQAPFKKVKGVVQLVLFHPAKPHFFVAVSIRFIRLIIYIEVADDFRHNVMSEFIISQSRSC